MKATHDWLVYGTYGKSIGPKAVLTALHAIAVGASGWVLFGGGFELLFRWTGKTAAPDHILSRSLVFACAAIYFVRISYGSLFLYKRTMSYGEGTGIGLFVIFVDVLFAFFGRSNPNPIGWVMLLGAVLYVLGSCLNTRSEYLRGVWKRNPANKGRLYAEGYFRYSRHVNYFGDELLFTGYALIAGSAWCLIVPALMACGFLFVNIPMLDRYLQRKYGAEFDAHAARTKKFVPYVH